MLDKTLISVSEGNNAGRSKEKRQQPFKVFNDYWSGGSLLCRTWIIAVVVSIYIIKGPKTDPSNYQSIVPIKWGNYMPSLFCGRLKAQMSKGHQVL